MDIYDSRYFVINKILLTSFGLWPYQKYEQKIFVRTLLIILMCFTMAPQILRIYLCFEDIDIVIEHVAVIIFMSITFLKLITTMMHEKKLEILYCDMAKNWTTIKDPVERRILIDYSERGRILTIIYVAYLLLAFIVFNILPFTPMVLNILKPLNESRPKIFILGGEFFVDRNTHYAEICIFDFFCTAISTAIMAAFDSMYVASVEHCLGLFAIIKFRLRSTQLAFTHVDPMMKHKQIIQTIQLHNNILIFTNTLELTYSSSFLILVGLNMMLVSFECILILIKLNHFMELVRFCFIWMGAVIHLFFLSWPGQKLIDYSASLFRDAFNNEWYESPFKSQKLLAFLSLRSLKPCYLTAGGIYVMNFENFAMILKTSLSYMTLFSSFR